MSEFLFKSELWTAQYTGIKANTLASFLRALQEADDDTIYYHLYRNLFEYHFMPTEYGNSFAYWLAENGYPILAEKFSSVDLMECVCLDDIRKEMVQILRDTAEVSDKICKPFHFIRAVRKTIDTGLRARNLEEFKECVQMVGIHSLFYHLVTSRLVRRHPSNDFAIWLEEIGESRRARLIDRIDLMVMSLYEARRIILDILES
jgi:hypothetical protein